MKIISELYEDVRVKDNNKEGSGKDLGSCSDWSCRVGNLLQPIRTTSQIGVVTHHQYGISALISQTLFRGETTGGVSNCILGDPGAVSRAGRKGATKVFKHRRKSPWVPTLTGPFPNGQVNAGSLLGTKNALYYCAQSANSFF